MRAASTKAKVKAQAAKAPIKEASRPSETLSPIDGVPMLTTTSTDRIGNYLDWSERVMTAMIAK